MFLFLILNPINRYKYSVLFKVNFVFQEIRKNPKHLQLWKICRRFSNDCYMFRQQYKIVVLKCCCSFLQNFSQKFCIYCNLSLACFCITAFGTCSSPCIKLYIPCSWLNFCLLAIHIAIPSLQYSALHCSFGTVIRFLVPLLLHIFCQAFFISDHFELLFQSF